MSISDYIQTQPLLPVAATLLLGIVVGDGLFRFLPILPSWSMLIWLSLMASCLCVEALLRRKPYAQSRLLLIAVFLAGMALADRAQRQAAFPFREDCQMSYEAVVTAEPQVRGKTLVCDLALVSIEGRQLDKAVNVKAHILRDTITGDWRRIRSGSGIEARSAMEPLRNYRKGNFDYARWLNCHGFRASTFVYATEWRTAKVSLKPMTTMERLRLKAMGIRQRLVAQLNLGNDARQQSAVVAAMVLGHKQGIDRDIKDAFSVSGASHVLALSGLHLGIIYCILTLLLGRRRKHGWLTQAVVVLSLWLYVLLVGMTPSIVRSAIMLSIHSLCMVGGRENISVNTLCLAAISLIVADPMCVWDLGFQLSFLAVLSIVTLYRPISHLLPKDGRLTGLSGVDMLLKAIWSTVAVSLAAQVGTAPLVAYYFGRFSCCFLLTNLVVMPCATVIIYCALAVLLTSFLPVVNHLLLIVLGRCSALLITAVTHIAALPGASVEGITINATETGCAYVLIGIACTLICHVSKLRGLSKLDAFSK